MAGFDIIVFSYHYPLSDPDCGDPAYGQAADRSDGGIGICGDHAGGQSGLHPHAGWGHSPVFRHRAHCDGVGSGAGAVYAVIAQHPAAQAAVRKAGDPREA